MGAELFLGGEGEKPMVDVCKEGCAVRSEGGEKI